MEANCTFSEGKWSSGRKFTCFVQSASTNEVNRTVKFNLKKKIGGWSCKDVQAIYFIICKLPVFPLNLTKTFPNLTVLCLENCGLTEISKDDLVGLEDLVELILHNNKLQSLPSDLFSDMKNLKWIILSNNEIQYLDSKMFDGIKDQIEVLDLSANVNINDSWNKGKGRSIDSFMRIIESKCEKTVNALQKNPLAEIYESEKFPQKTLKFFKDLWLTRRYYDFTIVVAEAEFKVHKAVLAMQSEVFAAMFDNDLEERKTNRMTIPDFSSAAFEDFLSYLYIGKIQSELNAMELFSLAAKYNVADLKSIAEETILNNVDESNALVVLAFANLHDSEVLMTKSFDLVKRAHPDITFNEGWMKKPDVVKTFVEAKAQHDLAVQEARKKLEEAKEHHDKAVEEARKKLEEAQKKLEEAIKNAV